MNRWIKDKYGSRRGALQVYRYRLLFFFGKYHAYRRVNWDVIDRLVFVCKGNICRSAYAEAVAKSLGIDSVSCGVDTRNDHPANEKAIIAAKIKGFDLSEHRTTSIQVIELRDSDLLVAMEPWQAEYINQEYGKKCKCSLLGLWGKPVRPHIQDPYGTSSLYFNYCFNYIEKSVHEIAGKISK